jgi:hypothetical protein
MFNIGDRVIYIYKGKRYEFKGGMQELDGLNGTVIDIHLIDFEGVVGIQFDESIRKFGGHNCEGRGKEGYCRYVSKNEVEHIEEKGDIKWFNGDKFENKNIIYSNMITKFDNYIKEEFNLIHKIGVAMDLSKPDDDIIKKIIRIVRKQGVDEGRYKVEYLDNGGKTWRPSRINSYVIIRVPKDFKDVDPYGEEEWEENKPIRIRIDRHVYEHNWRHYYMFYVNDRKLEVSDSNVETLIELLERPSKRREEERERAKKRANDDLRKDLFN